MTIRHICARSTVALPSFHPRRFIPGSGYPVRQSMRAVVRGDVIATLRTTIHMLLDPVLARLTRLLRSWCSVQASESCIAALRPTTMPLRDWPDPLQTLWRRVLALL